MQQSIEVTFYFQSFHFFKNNLVQILLVFFLRSQDFLVMILFILTAFSHRKHHLIALACSWAAGIALISLLQLAFAEPRPYMVSTRIISFNCLTTFGFPSEFNFKTVVLFYFFNKFFLFQRHPVINTMNSVKENQRLIKELELSLESGSEGNGLSSSDEKQPDYKPISGSNETKDVLKDSQLPLIMIKGLTQEEIIQRRNQTKALEEAKETEKIEEKTESNERERSTFSEQVHPSTVSSKYDEVIEEKYNISLDDIEEIQEQKVEEEREPKKTKRKHFFLVALFELIYLILSGWIQIIAGNLTLMQGFAGLLCGATFIAAVHWHFADFFLKTICCVNELRNKKRRIILLLSIQLALFTMICVILFAYTEDRESSTRIWKTQISLCHPPLSLASNIGEISKEETFQYQSMYDVTVVVFVYFLLVFILMGSGQYKEKKRLRIGKETQVRRYLVIFVVFFIGGLMIQFEGTYWIEKLLLRVLKCIVVAFLMVRTLPKLLEVFHISVEGDFMKVMETMEIKSPKRKSEFNF